jgi:hypothetical protein
MRRVIVEVPTGDRDYVDAVQVDCVQRGEAPLIASTLYAPVPGGAEVAVNKTIAVGAAWRPVADATVVYLDLGTTNTMAEGIAAAARLGQRVEYRQLGGRWEK